MNLILALTWMLSAGGGEGEAKTIKVAVVPTQLDASVEGKVPELLDDYILAAVQDLGGIETIGQDDIVSLIDFERQKVLLGCDEASCFSDLGGALGVDKLMVAKLAMAGDKWVVTTKLINTQTTAVESRTNDLVAGDVDALLQAMGRIIPELFGRADAAAVSGGEAPVTVEQVVEETPSGPTSVELKVSMAIFLLGAQDPTIFADIPADEEELLRKWMTLAPRIVWREGGWQRFGLLLEAAIGFGSHRYRSGGQAEAVDRSTVWVELLQLVRLPLRTNNERFLLMPSERFAMEVGLGGHLVLGPASEVGITARVELQAAWLAVGANATVASSTGLQVGPSFALRFAF